MIRLFYFNSTKKQVMRSTLKTLTSIPQMIKKDKINMTSVLASASQKCSLDDFT